MGSDRRNPSFRLGPLADFDCISPDDGITELLGAWSSGDPEAGDELLRKLWGRLQSLASSFLRREREDHTLQTTALINEAYLRLIRQESISWQHRDHFFAIVGRMMRRILVDHARRRQFVKHGGDHERLPPEVLEHHVQDQRDRELVALDGALDALSEENPDLARVVELRFFVGLTGEEIADTLGISTPTVQRRWQTARAWLYRQMKTSYAAAPEGPAP